MSCFSQQESVVPLSEYAISKIKKRNEFVKKYADSLNKFKYHDGYKIPDFFFEYDFDYQYHGPFKINIEDATSFRKLIIDKIDNIALLRVVVESKDKRLFKTVKHKHSMHNLFGITPFIDYSTHELVKYRLEELINDPHSGKPNYPDNN